MFSEKPRSFTAINSQTVNASWISATSIWLAEVFAILYASRDAITLVVNSVNSFFAKLAEFVFCPIPEIHTGWSENLDATFSDANNTDVLPEHG